MSREVKTEYIFLTVLIVLNIAASVMNIVIGNVVLAVGNIAAATLTACVTYTGGEA